MTLLIYRITPFIAFTLLAWTSAAESRSLSQSYYRNLTRSVTALQTPVQTSTSIKPAKVKNLAAYPDLKLKQIPTTPLTTEFVIEHRSALNGKTVQVKGVVVAALSSPMINLQTAPVPTANANPQGRIMIASTIRKDRDKNYDLTILLPEGERGYLEGNRVIVTGVVEANRNAIVMRLSR